MSRRVVITLLIVVGGTVACCLADGAWIRLWPPVAALLVIIATRHALFGLLAGGLVGAMMLAGGNPADGGLGHACRSPGTQPAEFLEAGAIVFTLVLGGFAADSRGRRRIPHAAVAFRQARTRSAPPDGNRCGRSGTALLL